MFWKQGDFGFAAEGLGEMKTYCEPQEPVNTHTHEHVSYQQEYSTAHTALCAKLK